MNLSILVCLILLKGTYGVIRMRRDHSWTNIRTSRLSDPRRYGLMPLNAGANEQMQRRLDQGWDLEYTCEEYNADEGEDDGDQCQCLDRPGIYPALYCEDVCQYCDDMTPPACVTFTQTSWLYFTVRKYSSCVDPPEYLSKPSR